MDNATRTHYVNSQLWNISDHLYEELKLIECGKHSLGALPFQVIQGLRQTTNIFLDSEDAKRIEECCFYCIKKYNNGDYDNHGSCRGILDKKSTGLLDDFDFYTRKIIQIRINQHFPLEYETSES